MGTSINYDTLSYTVTITNQTTGAGHIQFSAPVNFDWLSANQSFNKSVQTNDLFIIYKMNHDTKAMEYIDTSTVDL